jgi:hypothetical protein
MPPDRLRLTLLLCFVPAMMVLTANTTHADDLVPEVILSPPLPNGLGALPRLAGHGTAVDRINAELQRRDQIWAEDGCVATPTDPDSETEREAELTHVSPQFLSIIEFTGGYCAGAAHPFHDTRYLTFDMKSGNETDWNTLLPGGLVADGHPSAALLDFYLSATEPAVPAVAEECADFVSDARFTFWLDDDKHALGLAPVGLPYIATPCENEAFLDLATLERFGFPRRLIDALRD